MTSMIHTNVLRLGVLTSLLLLITVSGCYYDDGPVLSLRSTKGRIANTWKFEYAEALGVDVTSDFSSALLQLAKDGGLVFDLGNGTIYTGNWSLSFDRKLITMTFGDGTNDFEEVFVILRLKDAEMWLQEEIADQKRWDLYSD